MALIAHIQNRNWARSQGGTDAGGAGAAPFGDAAWRSTCGRTVTPIAQPRSRSRTCCHEDARARAVETGHKVTCLSYSWSEPTIESIGGGRYAPLDDRPAARAAPNIAVAAELRGARGHVADAISRLRRVVRDADSVVDDAHHDALPDADADINGGRVSVARRVRQRFAERREQLCCDRFIEGVDRPFEM